MSEYKTNLIGISPNVCKKIKRAAKKTDGILILSKKEFSFNNIVGIKILM